MYLYHYGIRELPFTLTPNTHFFFGLPSHKEALDVLLAALKTGEGFIKVVGEVGTGKTLICRKLLNEIPDHFVTAYIPNPYLAPDELRRSVAAELGVDLAEHADQQQFTQAIQQKLLEIHRRGNSVVLILDEAQALPMESLEALRLFTNLETESRKLLQVVLFGQPELDERLADPAIRQLRQRITFSYKLRAMNLEEVKQYISHRLKVAGYKGPNIFSGSVCKAIYMASRGIPRLVNVLCHKALMLSYGQGKHQVIKEHVLQAITDTEDALSLADNSKVIWLVVGLIGISVATVAWFLKQGGL